MTATPCKHGPPASRLITGDVSGFALRREGQQHGAVWISGDTVLYDSVRQVASRVTAGTALLHLGGVQFGVTGPVLYTMTVKDGGELLGLVHARAPAIPIHYEGWTHFRQDRSVMDDEFAKAPASVRDGVRWAPIGPRLR